MANLSPRKINLFLLMKLPSAFLCGVRVKELTEARCVVSVKHRWINQNPFRSMYFAVQAMAAELTTGALVMSEIRKSGGNISMLVGSNRADFSKKATGRITFTCNDGHLVSQAVTQSIATGEGQAISLKSIGTDENGAVVSEMEFEWNVKVK
ncbi:MAG TPA: DUF4442 domain-containing protein [Flavobacterium sp.]|nr:DUF4442 domain-containing protein [Flavobacterium sp.]